jgi:hypothetical protein
MENYKKVLGNNNCEKDIKSLKITNNITNNPQEVPNTLTEYCLTVADTVTRDIEKANNDPRDNVNPSNYLINKCNSTFPRINWTYVTS